MRARMLPAIATAAVLGAALALAVAKTTGWLGATTNATYVIREPVSAVPAAARVPAPPAVQGFRPARI
jgi:hypothetical protein